MVKKLLLLVAFFFAVFFVVVSQQPSEFRVTRSATLNAPPSKVFAQVNDLHAWQAWSPWARLDPTAKNSFDGPAAGVGASMAWVGNKEVGEGRMTITESKINQMMQMRLDFKKPFEATSTTEFTFQQEGKNTRMNWAMSGHNNFMGKAISLFMDCDQMVGGQFEKGFENLRTVVETPSTPAPKL